MKVPGNQLLTGTSKGFTIYLTQSVHYKTFLFVEGDFSSCNLEPFLFFLLRGDGESVNSVIVFLFLGDAVSL